MSYPSVVEILASRGLDLATAPESTLRQVLCEAAWKNLPKGMSYLKAFSDTIRLSGERKLAVEDPNSLLGQELTRLLGTDIARSACEEHFGVAFGLYNCCAPVGAPTRGDLNMTIQEQLTLQTSANC